MRLLAIVVAGLLLSSQSRASDVIANSAISLSADEVREVFLGERQLLGAVRLVPIDNSSIQAEFLSKVLQTDSAKYNARWTRKTFREGLPAPPLKGSDSEVIAFVRATPGAIGYVRKAPAGMTVVYSY
jgi:ABC-type phosphate transport system substrate-binding protein